MVAIFQNPPARTTAPPSLKVMAAVGCFESISRIESRALIFRDIALETWYPVCHGAPVSLTPDHCLA